MASEKSFILATQKIELAEQSAFSVEIHHFWYPRILGFPLPGSTDSGKQFPYRRGG
jgi:hypothetical protein